MENNKQPLKTSVQKAARDGFTSGLGVIVATLGSAVGLGNIWKFPYMVGENGGAAFIIVYLISTLLVGLPVMISEHMLGRTAKADAISTLQKLAPKKQPWWLIGAAGVLAAFVIMAFYTEVVGWILAYIVKSASGKLLTTNPEITGSAFAAVIGSPWLSLILQWIVLVYVSLIIIAGVSKGIEAAVKKLIPALLVMLIIVCIRSLTLPGAGEGVSFLFKPDFSKLTGAAILAALGLAFFKLSIGMGTMITYGSYFRDDQNIPVSATKVMLGDLCVSLLAGLAIFPAVFAYGVQVDAGPSLLFITIPTVFASMPAGNIFMVIFFILSAVAATGAMLSLFEVPVAFLSDKFGMARTKATWLTALALALVGSTAALSGSVFADVSILGRSFFDFYDFLSSNILLPIGGFFICIFVGWVWGFGKIEKALSNNDTLENSSIIRVFFFLVRWISPILILIILLSGLGVIKV